MLRYSTGVEVPSWKVSDGTLRLLRERIQDQVEATPNRNGWAQRSKAIVIAPELESWLWSPAEAVAQRLGWGGDFGPLQRWLDAKGLWPAGQFKPPDPKGAMEQALRHKKKVRSSALFGELAASVQFARCRDPAFVELRQILREWFPLTKL